MDGTVANARLLSLTIERFKSYKEATTIELSPLTVILGRNNSGKSSIINLVAKFYLPSAGELLQAAVRVP